MAATFSDIDLYEYQKKNGIVMPQTADVKAKVEEAFKDIFGSSFSTETETPQGRLIEAITLLFVNTLKVNALNANSLNINQAVGEYLDNLGAVYDVTRQTGEGDDHYRANILASASRGSGFAASIRQAVGEVIVNSSTSATIGANNVVVMENGLEDPQMLPRAEDGSSYAHSVSLDPHSVIISVLSPAEEGENAKIATAIRNSKSAGCAYSDVQGGTKQTVYINDAGSSVAEAQASFKAVFVRPQRLYVKLALTVIDSAYTGEDVKSATAQAVLDMIATHHMNDTISKADIAAAVASAGKGIVCTAVGIQVSDTQESTRTYVAANSIIIPCYKYVNVTASDITVTVNNTLE